MHIKDSQGHVFATRLNYVFTIGKVVPTSAFCSLIFCILIFRKHICSTEELQGNKPFISLPKGKGVKLTIAEERDKRLGI